MFIDLILIVILKTLQQTLRILPEDLQRNAGIFFGRLGFLFLKGRRRVAIANIKRVFRDYDDARAIATAKNCFEKLGTNFIELILMPYLPKEEYGTRFTIENRHYFDEALKASKGIIALTFHYGNWEIMGVASHTLKRDVIALARPLKKHAMLNRFLNSLRESTGLTIILNANTSREVMKNLKENKIIAILGDQREKRSRGVFVEFFGEKVPTTRGVATIGMKTGTPVLPVYPQRKGFMRYTIVCGAPLDLRRKGDINELVYENTRKMNAFLESIILKNPDEWFWVHRRWGRKEKHGT